MSSGAGFGMYNFITKVLELEGNKINPFKIREREGNEKIQSKTQEQPVLNRESRSLKSTHTAHMCGGPKKVGRTKKLVD